MEDEQKKDKKYTGLIIAAVIIMAIVIIAAIAVSLKSGDKRMKDSEIFATVANRK